MVLIKAGLFLIPNYLQMGQQGGKQRLFIKAYEAVEIFVSVEIGVIINRKMCYSYKKSYPVLLKPLKPNRKPAFSCVFWGSFLSQNVINVCQ